MSVSGIIESDLLTSADTQQVDMCKASTISWLHSSLSSSHSTSRARWRIGVWKACQKVLWRTWKLTAIGACAACSRAYKITTLMHSLAFSAWCSQSESLSGQNSALRPLSSRFLPGFERLNCTCRKLIAEEAILWSAVDLSILISGWGEWAALTNSNPPVLKGNFAMQAHRWANLATYGSRKSRISSILFQVTPVAADNFAWSRLCVCVSVRHCLHWHTFWESQTSRLIRICPAGG